MQKRMLSVIVSFFIFTFSIPQTCFADLVTLFEKNTEANITNPAMKVVNLLDISKKIADNHISGARKFFREMYFVSADNKDMPEINTSRTKVILNFYDINLLSSKQKKIYVKENQINSLYSDAKLRHSPPGNHSCLTKIYLLSLEALHKGSVPASGAFISKTNSVCLIPA